MRRSRTALWSALIVGLVAALLVGVLATRQSAATKQADSPLLGQPAPDVAGTALDGSPVSLARLRGQWALVNFFATWCVPCREEHPELAAFSRQHPVVSVVYGDDKARVREFFSEHGGDWPVVDDPDGRVALNFGVRGVPESFLLDPDGVVAARIIGGVQAPALDRLVRRAAAARR